MGKISKVTLLEYASGVICTFFVSSLNNEYILRGFHTALPDFVFVIHNAHHKKLVVKHLTDDYQQLLKGNLRKEIARSLYRYERKKKVTDS